MQGIPTVCHSVRAPLLPFCVTLQHSLTPEHRVHSGDTGVTLGGLLVLGGHLPFKVIAVITTSPTLRMQLTVTVVSGQEERLI